MPFWERGWATEADLLGDAARERFISSDWRHSLAISASRMRADLTFAFVDVFLVLAAYTLGLGFRMLDPMVGDPRVFWIDLAIAMPAIVGIHLLANVLAGAYGHVWEHASADEAGQVVVANAIAGGVVLSLALIMRGQLEMVIPYSVIVVGAGLSLSGMGLVRFRSRLFSFKRTEGSSRILIAGNGGDAAVFARQVPYLPGGARVIGFLADDVSSADSVRRLAGLPIVGSITDIAEVVHRHDIDQVVVVGNDPIRTREVVDRCLDVDVRLRILPRAEDVMLGRTSALDIRDIRVEDLLIRPPIATDLSELAGLLEGRRVLVTGAGGSIGSEIVRQVLQFDPAGVWALDRDETLLHDAGLQWLGATNAILCDIRDARKLLDDFDRIRPEIVFHAAALKHVPMLEAHPEQAVLANVIGTRNVIEAGSRAGMERFVLVSTDKAVNPSSVMGASKRVAEFMTQVGNERRDGCVYTAVRFGNVLGSRGSVIPTFVEQIKKGGPVTVTDGDMTRYFITLDESVQLVLQAAALARGSEVFLLDMGDPVKIVDLARRLIRLAGLSPERDIEIVFTGRRPGEKLVESLSTAPLRMTRNSKIFEVGELEPPPATLLFGVIADLEEAATSGDRESVTEILNGLTGYGSHRLSSSELAADRAALSLD